MDENAFEGTVVLEKLAEIGQLDAFLTAIDADDFDRVRSLLKKADLDAETIVMVLTLMSE